MRSPTKAAITMATITPGEMLSSEMIREYRQDTELFHPGSKGKSVKCSPPCDHPTVGLWCDFKSKAMCL